MKKWTATAITALLIGLGGLIPAQHGRAVEKIPVFVSIPPQKYFVKAIGGAHVDVAVMVTPGHAPETFEPGPAQMKRLAAAKVYFAAGVPFETSWLHKFSGINPNMAIVHTDAGIKKLPIQRHDEHGPVSRIKKPVFHHHDQHHDCGKDDPHIWLSPPLVMHQAEHILAGLIQASPGLQAEFEANYASFAKELKELDAELRQLFAGHADGLFLVFHPSWGYFADAYGLQQVSIEFEGKEPKAKDIQTLIAYARDAGIRTIFIQPQFSTRQAEIIASEIKGSLVPADPLAENWMENIRSVATSLKEALR
jgi:zinc transport system substrate-binding protein